MAGRVGTTFAVIVTAVITAAVTSAIWLWLYNVALEDRSAEPARTEAEVPATEPAPPTATDRSTPVEVDVATIPAALADDYRALANRRLTIPVSGVGQADLTNTFGDDRAAGERRHEALDIPAARGTPVVAVEDGRVEKLFTSEPGGLTIYQFDPTRAYAYYYAHLDRYADGLAEGQLIKRGQVIGYVGSTGNASPNAPHLHFAIFKLGPEKRWYEGTPINPFTVFGGTIRPPMQPTMSDVPGAAAGTGDATGELSGGTTNPSSGDGT